MKKNRLTQSIKDQKYVNILGISILSTSVDGLLTAIEHKVSRSQRFSIFTPNPELIIATKDNSKLKDVLNAADFLVPDGVGLNFASKFLYGSSINVIPGRKLYEMLIAMAVKNKWRVFLLGGLDNETVLTAENLISQYPEIEISTSIGPKLNKDGRPDSTNDLEVEKEVITKINEFKPHLLFVAFGNPKQELWIYKNLPRLNVFGAMAVGGTFRYVAGFSKLPPRWMEQIGLEWLWRVLTEPRRLERVFNAVIVFPLKVVFSKRV